MLDAIDVSAPGVSSIVHTTGIGRTQFESFSGTSAAGPHVAGLAALILSEGLEQGISLHHEDVESIIKFSSEDTNGEGYDDDLGHGRINAGKALEMMNDPWVFDQREITGGNIVNTETLSVDFERDRGGILNGRTIVRRHEVRRTLVLPDIVEPGELYVWGRGSNETSGWSPDTPNHQLGFCDIVSISGTVITLRTHIYESLFRGFPISNPVGIFPTTAENVNFAYSVLYRPRCQDNLQLFNSLNTDVTYQSSNQITTSQNIRNGANAMYSAPTITFNPGFNVELGSSFDVRLESCANLSGIGISSLASKGEVVNELLSEEVLINDNLIDFKVYPIPFKDILNFEYLITEDSLIEFKIFDITGKVVNQIEYESESNEFYRKQINTSSMNEGVYLYQIKTNDFLKSGKIIKTN